MATDQALSNDLPTFDSRSPRRVDYAGVLADLDEKLAKLKAARDGIAQLTEWDAELERRAV